MTTTQVVGAGDLFQVLRDGRPRTRAELVQETGLARTTVVVWMNALADLGLITPAGTAASSGGRPPSRFVFDPHAQFILGIDLGATHGTIGLTDLDGKVIARHHEQLDIAAGPTMILDQALDAASNLLKARATDPGLILGVGIGVPGPVEHSTGRPIRPPIMPGWDGFDIPNYVRRQFDVPVLVDNDVNILALGERATAWPDVDDLLFIKVSTGIGAGIVAGGVLQRGAQGAAGDIGHVQVPHGRGEDDLEATASGPAIARELSERFDAHLDAGDLVDRIRIGDPHAVEAAREAGRSIGEVAAICVSMLNPSTVVVGGRLGVEVQEIIAGVREVVYRRSIPLATQHLSIVPAQGGVDAGVRGAALMVIEDQLSAIAIDDRLATTNQSQR
ncbi:putative NBD/HSP70 family sugar kinase [Microcella putealis]|uniref:Putative NBD/HSP70 family sugar kinase n=1 Tax=Microcella putealis TaxID=337005 RepID=A0A4Q7LXV1_9MICO|nr:ROK family protein [Microcella putealis]RZS59624.1 putative NBD/HSP70 family sugar kinase [Microcella putealis]TQM26737.1 putative NBD/HSP70 family sugar kinase [Microcella putealis]